jgi:hypothetical protein
MALGFIVSVPIVKKKACWNKTVPLMAAVKQREELGRG